MLTGRVYPARFGPLSVRLDCECPGGKCKASYASMGRFDVVDIVKSDDPTQVRKAARTIRGCGRASTEILRAIPWHQFRDAL